MIKVCDAIMGSGKSSATITFINENPQNKYIYITPYLDEANRIKESCPDARFVEPSDKIPKYKFSKQRHTEALIREGRNISTTHACFLMYKQETLQAIKEYGYILFVDESLEVLEGFEYENELLDFAVECECVSIDNQEIHKTKDVSGIRSDISPVLSTLDNRELMYIDGGENGSVFSWLLPKRFLESFKEVYILTYLFDGQPIKYFMDICNLPYEKIGIAYDGHVYRFSTDSFYIPEYVRTLSSHIHIETEKKINAIGDDKYALSMAWFEKHPRLVDNLRKNTTNFFRWRNKCARSSDVLWSTFKDYKKAVKNKGYANSFLPFNTRATNKFKDRRYLAYLTNVFMNVSNKLIYTSCGAEVDEDAYALSVMVQWIWRSAIRDGKDVYLYIPSKRMRTILMNWMKSLEEGGSEGV